MRITELKKTETYLDSFYSFQKTEVWTWNSYLPYELSNIPQAIANNDESLTKTNKAQTRHDLEANVQPLDHNKLMQVIGKLSTAVFVDHMACVQKLTSSAGISTFGDLYNGLTKFVEVAFRKGDTVHVVSDKYDTRNSIKAGERKCRGNVADSPEIVVHSANQILPRNMMTFIANPKNKDHLNNFIFSEWEKTIPQKITDSGSCWLLL